MQNSSLRYCYVWKENFHYVDPILVLLENRGLNRNTMNLNPKFYFYNNGFEDLINNVHKLIKCMMRICHVHGEGKY